MSISEDYYTINMTSDQEHNLFREFVSVEEDILFSKASDYANHDVLSNFKKVANVLDITPQQYCVQMITTKIVRLANLIGSNKAPKHESIQDSIHDLRNYAFLLGCILEESRPDTTPNTTPNTKVTFPSEFSNFQQKQTAVEARSDNPFNGPETLAEFGDPDPEMYSEVSSKEALSEDALEKHRDDEKLDDWLRDGSVRKLTA